MRSFMPWVAGSFAVSCGLLACAPSVDYLATRIPSHPLRLNSAAAVEVFYHRGPDRPFTEIGLFEALEGASGAGIGRGELVDALRERAAQIGCDAVLILGPTDVTTGCSNVALAGVAPSSAPKTRKGFEASCLVFDGS
jgi:hypothetical protein